MLQICEMTRKEFDALPWRESLDKDWADEIEFDSMVVLPGRAKDMHDSGYRCMDFAAVRKGEAVCRLSGCSDVIHIEGIGGFGRHWLEKYGTCPSLIPATSWSIDCLPKSGLLQLFPGTGKMCCGSALSSFEIYQLPKEDA